MGVSQLAVSNPRNASGKLLEGPADGEGDLERRKLSMLGPQPFTSRPQPFTSRTLLAALAVVPLGGCRALDPCETEIRREVPSPDGALIAVVYERGCGATVGFNTQVGLRTVRAQLDLDDGQVVALSGQHDLRPIWTWTTQSTLSIAIPEARVYRQLSKWNGIAIAYEKKQP